MKKSLEIIGWLIIEIGLVYLLAVWITMPTELKALLTGASVFFGKILVTKYKENKLKNEKNC